MRHHLQELLVVNSLQELELLTFDLQWLSASREALAAAGSAIGAGDEEQAELRELEVEDEERRRTFENSKLDLRSYGGHPRIRS